MENPAVTMSDSCSPATPRVSRLGLGLLPAWTDSACHPTEPLLLLPVKSRTCIHHAHMHATCTHVHHVHANYTLQYIEYCSNHVLHRTWTSLYSLIPSREHRRLHAHNTGAKLHTAMGVPRHPGKRKVLAMVTPSPPYMHPPHPNNVYPQADHQAEQR